LPQPAWAGDDQRDEKIAIGDGLEQGNQLVISSGGKA